MNNVRSLLLATVDQVASLKGKIVTGGRLNLHRALLMDVPTVREAWVARYDGPGNGFDEATDIAVEGQGNVYVTGHSDGSGSGLDYATIKYDASGNQPWVARYDGPASLDDETSAMEVDSGGNVYITGMSNGVGTNEDYATIKYDSSGNQLWVARYDGPASGVDQAKAIEVDSGGNVYITGMSNGVGTNEDYATIKYDGSGNELWAARYDGPVSGVDQARSIEVDSGGNVYVTGWSDGGGTSFDYATIKYDSSGNQVWVARYDGPANSNDIAKAIEVDGGSNVYVTGESVGTGAGLDYATIKYDSSGNQLWVARYDGPASLDDEASAMEVDSGGNVYVTGESAGTGTGLDYATIKYDSSGNQLWVARYDGPASLDDAAWAMEVDGGGNVYVTGESVGTGTDFDYATIKNVQAMPDIDVTPSAVEVTVAPEGKLEVPLDVLNRGPVALDWSAAEDPDVPWLSLTPSASGIVAKGSVQAGALELAFDATGLALGDYATTLSFTSNDLANPVLVVPMTFHVAVLLDATAATVQNTGVDALDGAAGMAPSVSQVYDSVTLDPLPLVKLAGYGATLTYDSTLLNVLDVRSQGPFDPPTGVSIDNVLGTATFSASAPDGQPWPVEAVAVGRHPAPGMHHGLHVPDPELRRHDRTRRAQYQPGAVGGRLLPPWRRQGRRCHQHRRRPVHCSLPDGPQRPGRWPGCGQRRQRRQRQTGRGLRLRRDQHRRRALRGPAPGGVEGRVYGAATRVRFRR